MANTMNSNKSDQLIDVLKQVQARKTVRPEDATKALQQYYKVQEHIKALKSEIELFKANQEQKEGQARPIPQTKGKAPITRKNSINSQNNGNNQQSSVTRQPPRNINGTVQTNGTSGASSRSPRRPSKVSTNDDVRSQGTQSSKLVTKNGATGIPKPSNPDSPEKDKEVSRLKLPNTQAKVTPENKVNKEPNAVAGMENGNKVTLLQKRDIPVPAQLVEEFKKIYNTEYKTAYHDLEHHYKLKEDNITELLAAIAKEAYTFCTNTSKQQFDDIFKAHAHVIDVLVQPKYVPQIKDKMIPKSKSIIDKEGYQVTRRFLKDYRRAMAKFPIPGLIEIFETIVQRDVLSRHTALRITPKASRPYIHRLIEVSWYMSMHEPPLVQVWPRGGQLMNRDWFTPYGKKGATIIHTVWPALLDHKDGTLAERGLCLVK